LGPLPFLHKVTGGHLPEYAPPCPRLARLTIHRSAWFCFLKGSRIATLFSIPPVDPLRIPFFLFFVASSQTQVRAVAFFSLSPRRPRLLASTRHGAIPLSRREKLSLSTVSAGGGSMKEFFLRKIFYVPGDWRLRTVPPLVSPSVSSWRSAVVLLGLLPLLPEPLFSFVRFSPGNP